MIRKKRSATAPHNKLCAPAALRFLHSLKIDREQVLVTQRGGLMSQWLRSPQRVGRAAQPCVQADVLRSRRWAVRRVPSLRSAFSTLSRCRSSWSVALPFILAATRLNAITLGMHMTDLPDGILTVVVLGIFLAVVLLHRSAPRCPKCARPHAKSASFCRACGTPVRAEASARLSAPMDAGAILRRTTMVVFVYVGGFVPLWLLSFFEVAPASALMVVFAAYALGGAAISAVVYARLSRCAACHRFVELNHVREFSANFCSHCGNRVHA
jgi:hypothetical protein